MEVRVTADPGELEEKAGELLKSLALQLSVYDPKLRAAAELLSKAEDSPSDQVSMRYPVMRDLSARAKLAHKDQMGRMLEEIEQVLKE